MQRDGVSLVRLRPQHAAALTAGLDEAIWTLWPKPLQTMADVQAYIEARLADPACKPFAILSDGEVAGATTLYGMDSKHRHATIGWTFILPPYRRTKTNTAAKLLLLQHAFEDMGLIRIQFDVDGRNTRSQDAVRRLGAKHEGTLRRHKILHDGFVRDTTIWSILDEEWPGVKAGLERRLEQGPAGHGAGPSIKEDHSKPHVG